MKMKIKESIKEINLGKLKMWQTRASTYVSVIQFALVFYLFIVQNDWFDWYVWLVLFVISGFLMVFVDTVKVMPEQLAYGFRKNPEWRKMKRNQKRIMDKLGISDTYED